MNSSRAIAMAALLAQLACLGDARRPRADAGAADASTGGVKSRGIRVATFNVRRFFDTLCDSGRCGPGEYEELPTPAQFEAKAEQIAAAIRGFEAQVVALQEVETQGCLDALQAHLVDVLPSSVLGETGAAASVDVAILAAGPIVRVARHRDRVLVRPDGTTTLFSRELLEVHLELDEQSVVAFAAHFRSKVSDDPGRRLAEAQSTHERVVQAAAERPNALVVLAGDLNDVPGSAPLEALEADGKLLRVARELPANEQATVVFNGVGEAIDHIFQATPGAGTYVKGSARVPRGYNAGSDHDPLLADFDPSP